MLQFLDPKFITNLKKHFPWYVIVVLAGVVIVLYKSNNTLNREITNLYRIGAVKDSVISAQKESELIVYRKFMMGMNELLFMQKFQIQKTDTLISRVTKNN